jgi:hypothetical protein
MHGVLWLLVAGVAITVTGCSTGSRTVKTGPGAANATWVDEAGWVCDGNSCHVPEHEIQSRWNG